MESRAHGLKGTSSLQGDQKTRVDVRFSVKQGSMLTDEAELTLGNPVVACMDNSNNSRPLVLVVDDEALLRMYEADMLDDAGFEVVEAADADEALSILEARPDVRVLFTDINMPGRLNGLDLAHQVHLRWPSVVLLVTSGRECPQDHEIADAGRFVRKPFEADTVVRHIREMMSEK